MFAVCFTILQKGDFFYKSQQSCSSTRDYAERKGPANACYNEQEFLEVYTKYSCDIILWIVFVLLAVVILII